MLLLSLHRMQQKLVNKEVMTSERRSFVSMHMSVPSHGAAVEEHYCTQTLFRHDQQAMINQ